MKNPFSKAILILFAVQMIISILIVPFLPENWLGPTNVEGMLMLVPWFIFILYWVDSIIKSRKSKKTEKSDLPCENKGGPVD